MKIVKRRGHEEKYDERKIYGSVYAACVNADFTHISAEKIASQVSKSITLSIKSQRTISSNVLFKKIGILLGQKYKKVKFMYESHRDIC